MSHRRPSFTELSPLTKQDSDRTNKITKRRLKTYRTTLDLSATRNTQEISSIRHNEDDFICPICLQLMVAITTVPCGHAFCEHCIRLYLLNFPVD